MPPRYGYSSSLPAFQKCESKRHIHNALVEHGIGDFYESSDVRANYEIAGVSVLFRSVPGVFKDRRHDVA